MSNHPTKFRNTDGSINTTAALAAGRRARAQAAREGLIGIRQVARDLLSKTEAPGGDPAEQRATPHSTLG